MIAGFDCYSPVAADLARKAKAASLEFVGRYYGTGGKVLLSPEVETLGSAGIQIISYFERSASRAMSGRAAGLSDGGLALHQARAVGQPTGTPIYFAVDFDPAPQAHSTIADYFSGVRASLGSDYKVGVYGSGAVCAAMLNGFASHAALSGAMGWRGSNEFLASNKWHIRQHATLAQRAKGNVLGIDYDPLECRDLDEAGAWLPQGKPIHRALEIGDSGPDVEELQRGLAAKGYDPGPVDGDYGPSTKAAVFQFVWTEMAK